MLFYCVVTRFQYYIFFEAIQSKIWKPIRSKFQKLFTITHTTCRGISDGFQMDFRGFSCFSGGFLGVFRVFSNEISDGFQRGFRGLSDCFQEVFSTSESDTLQKVFRA